MHFKDKHRTNKGSIAGRVTTRENKAVADAAVMVVGNSPDHHDIAMLTNETGEYMIDHLTPGEYKVLVNAENHPPQTLSTLVVADEITELNFLLED
jgi:protocatechuate 3,4-dioxygenase beta subunit